MILFENCTKNATSRSYLYSIHLIPSVLLSVMGRTPRTLSLPITLWFTIFKKPSFKNALNCWKVKRSNPFHPSSRPTDGDHCRERGSPVGSRNLPVVPTRVRRLFFFGFVYHVRVTTRLIVVVLGCCYCYFLSTLQFIIIFIQKSNHGTCSLERNASVCPFFGWMGGVHMALLFFTQMLLLASSRHIFRWLDRTIHS